MFIQRYRIGGQIKAQILGTTNQVLVTFHGQHLPAALSLHILNLHRVNAVCNPGNIASWKVLEHCGMRREAYLRQKCRYRKHGQDYWADELEYAILASEWLTDVGCKLEK